MTEDRDRGRRTSESRKHESSSNRRSSRSRSRSRTRTSRARSRSRSRSRSKRATRTRYQEDDFVEEGQEIMLIEEVQVQKTALELTGEQLSNQDNQQEQEQGTTRKSTRKVQQVLLVPTNGDLLMERYRQAAQRAMKARALLDQAMNWDATVVNRDRMAADAFTEAGKARLLIETEKTPELIAMLTDAKVKGEEEALRAQDTKVAKLIPSVKFPTTAAKKASASALAPQKRQTKGGFDQITETPTITNSVMMTKDPAMHCFDNVLYPQVHTLESEVTTFSGDEGYERDEEADEHVFRAKQYLEFILPDLGEMRDDSSMALKAVANPRSILHNYQIRLLQQSSNGLASYNLYSGSEGTGLGGEISSLGFDESLSIDNMSSGDPDEDLFSMTSLNEIMDTPLDEFDPKKILKMSSKQRKKLTIKMSFGSKSMQADETIVSPMKDEEYPKKKPAHMDATSPPHLEGAAAASTPVAAPRKDEAPDKKRRSLSFARMRTNATVPALMEEHTNNPGGFLSRFRSVKKSPRRESLLDMNTDVDVDAVNNLRIIGPVLSDLSDVQSQLLPGPTAQAEQATPINRTAAEGGEKRNEPKKQVLSKLKVSKPALLDQTQQLMVPERQPKDLARHRTSPKAKTSIAAVPTPLANLADDLEVPQSGSMGSSNQSEEDEIEDRYKVSILLCGEEDCDDNETVNQVAPYTPVSLASTHEAPSRYSPINCDGTPIARPQADGFSTSASIESHEAKLIDGAKVPVETVITSRTAPESHAKNNLQPSVLSNAREKPANNPKPKEPTHFVVAAQETGSRAIGTLSSIVPSNSEPKDKKKSRGLIVGMFNRKDREIAASTTRHAPPKSKAPVKIAGGKSGSKSVERTETAVHDEPKKADKKKRSSLQVSLKKANDVTTAQPASAPPKGGHVGSPLTKRANFPSPSPKKGPVPTPSPRKVAPASSSALKIVSGYSPPLKKSYATSPSPSQATLSSASSKKSHRIKSSKVSQNSKQGKCTSSPLPFHPKLKSKGRETNGSPFKRVSSSQSSLQMALQLSQETVEVMAMDEGGPTGVPSHSPLKASENIAAQPRNRKPPIASPAKQPRSRKKTGRRFDKRQLQEANHDDAPDKQGRTPKALSSHYSTSWMKNMGFHVNRKGQAKKSNPATSEQNSSVDSQSDNNENAPPLAIPSTQSPTPLAYSPLEASETTKLTCDTSMPQRTLPVLPTIASNPLLPYQLVKHLEEQNRMAAEMDMSVKDAAERSIIRSTTNAMMREGTLPITDRANGFDTTSPRIPLATFASSSNIPRDDVSGVQMRRNSRITPGSLPIPSSPRALGTSSSPYSRASNSPYSRTHHSRPDADGLNARPKDVREVLVGRWDEDEDLDVARSRSFLGRITQGAYRQDFDLPDP